MQQQRNPTIVGHHLAQIQDLQNNVHSLSDAREFHDPETASSSGATHVPSQPSAISSPRTMLCRDSALPHCTRDTRGVLQETFLKAYLLEKDHPQLSSKIPGIWLHLLVECDRTQQEIL